jgi:CTP:phosphocholine cytidylyltransferase-like protein
MSSAIPAQLLEDIAPNLIFNDCFDTKDNTYSLGLAFAAAHNDDALILDADLCLKARSFPSCCLTQGIMFAELRSRDLSESTGIIQDEDGR